LKPPTGAKSPSLVSVGDRTKKSNPLAPMGNTNSEGCLFSPGWCYQPGPKGSTCCFKMIAFQLVTCELCRWDGKEPGLIIRVSYPGFVVPVPKLDKRGFGIRIKGVSVLVIAVIFLEKKFSKDQVCLNMCAYLLAPRTLT